MNWTSSLKRSVVLALMPLAALAQPQPQAPVDNPRIDVPRSCGTLMVDMSGSMLGFYAKPSAGNTATLSPYQQLLQGLSGECQGNALGFDTSVKRPVSRIWELLPGKNDTNLSAAIEHWLAGTGKQPNQRMVLITDNVADLEDATARSSSQAASRVIDCENTNRANQSAASNEAPSAANAVKSQRDFICALRSQDRVAAVTVTVARFDFDGNVYGINQGATSDYRGKRALAIYSIQSGHRRSVAETNLDRMNDLNRSIARSLGRATQASFPVNPFNPLANSAIKNGVAPPRMLISIADGPFEPPQVGRKVGDNRRIRIDDVPMGSELEITVVAALTNGDLWQLNNLKSNGAVSWYADSPVRPKSKIDAISDGRALLRAGTGCKPLQSGGQGDKSNGVRIDLGPGEKVCPQMVFRLEKTTFYDRRGFWSQLVGWFSGKPIIGHGRLDLAFVANRQDIKLADQIQSEWSLNEDRNLATPSLEIQGKVYRLNDILRMAVASDETTTQSVAFSPEPIDLEIHFVQGSGFWAQFILVGLIFALILATIIWLIYGMVRSKQVTVTIGPTVILDKFIPLFGSASQGNTTLRRFGPIHLVQSDGWTGQRWFGAGILTLKSKSNSSQKTAEIRYLKGDKHAPLRQTFPGKPPMQKPPSGPGRRV